MNITLPDTIGLCHCILRVLPAIRFQIHQHQLVHLLLNPGTYERIIHYHTSYHTDHRFPIIKINCFVIHCCEFYHPKFNSSVHLFHDWTWNSTMFTNHNQLITPQKKLQKNRRSSISILGHMKKYSTIFNGIRPVKCENETSEHWKPPPVKYRFGC